MKQNFLKKEGNREMILFFAGWGSSPELFSEYRIADGHDCLMCYDYRDMSFDSFLIDGYDSMKVVAWSFGVFVANMVCSSIDGVNWTDAVAFGGTLQPVDDNCGIPETIFEGTQAGMSEQVLYKFRRRMCGRSIEHFMSHCPERTLEDLKEELAVLGGMACAERNAVRGNVERSGFHWTKAIAGRGDLIFPFANQRNAWNEAGVCLLQEEAAHYEVNMFERLLGGELFEG